MAVSYGNTFLLNDVVNTLFGTYLNAMKMSKFSPVKDFKELLSQLKVNGFPLAFEWINCRIEVYTMGYCSVVKETPGSWLKIELKEPTFHWFGYTLLYF